MKALPVCDTPFEHGRICARCGLRADVEGVKSCHRLVAESERMRALMRRVGQIASSDAPVVIEGESGTGKEVLARTLHANSRRAKRPFVAVNVAAMPSELLESELFGHAKGAFTGATFAKQGLFEEAAGGTLFLDEIGEMPHPLQAKLLRALQDGEVRRVGETRPFSVDVRVLCATNVDLAAAVAEGRFRADLYYRLRVFGLVVPPLRERKADILPLAHAFLARHEHRTRRFEAAAERALGQYTWPGNVRELANAVQHGAVLSAGAPIGVPHLPDDVVSRRASRAAPRLESLAEAERRHILWVLEACAGNQVEAARVLGIGRTTLWRKLRQAGFA